MKKEKSLWFVLIFFGLLIIGANESGKNLDQNNELKKLANTETEIIENNKMEKTIDAIIDYPVDENGKYIVDEIYWRTEGIDVYMDEVSPQSTRPFFWTQNFDDCDYDMDGLIDRVRMTREKEGTFYYTEFGNGDLLALGPFDDEKMGFYLTGGDLSGDGVPEMLFMGEHIRVGSYYTEFIVAQKVNGEYVYMDLPKSTQPDGSAGDKNRYEMGYDIYILSVDGNVATIGNVDAGIKVGVNIPKGKEKDYERNMKNKNVFGSSALMADIVRGEDSKKLKLQILFGDRHDEIETMFVEIYLKYEGNKWIIENTETKDVEEIDWWWWMEK